MTCTFVNQAIREITSFREDKLSRMRNPEKSREDKLSRMDLLKKKSSCLKNFRE